MAERVRNIQVGHPLDPTTEVGPLIHQRHFDKVKSYFSLATADGAEIKVGGHTLDSDGYFRTHFVYRRQ